VVFVDVALMWHWAPHVSPSPLLSRTLVSHRCRPSSAVASLPSPCLPPSATVRHRCPPAPPSLPQPRRAADAAWRHALLFSAPPRLAEPLRRPLRTARWGSSRRPRGRRRPSQPRPLPPGPLPAPSVEAPPTTRGPPRPLPRRGDHGGGARRGPSRGEQTTLAHAGPQEGGEAAQGRHREQRRGYLATTLQRGRKGRGERERSWRRERERMTGGASELTCGAQHHISATSAKTTYKTSHGGYLFGFKSCGTFHSWFRS